MFSVIFPGQGSQSVGMAKNLYNNYRFIKELFDKADEILGFSLSKIILEGPKEELDQTENTQPAIFLISYSIYNIVKKEFNLDLNKAKYFAGHSLGGMIAPAYALKFPDHVISVGLLSTVAGRAEEDSKKVWNVINEMEKNGIEKTLQTLTNRWFTDEFINKLKSEIPELPDDKKKRFIDKFKISPYEATILVSDIDTAKYFEEVVAKMGKNRDMKLAVNWITGELFAVLNNKGLEISQSPVSAKNFAILINLIKNGTISGKIAKTVFELMIDGDKDPQKIVEEKGLKQQSDPKALEALIDKIINDNREKAIEYKQGKEKLFGFFVGQAMKASGGKANPQLINEILKKKL